MERPILIFPEPEIVSKKPKTPFSSKVQVPPISRQIDRLSPKFSALLNAFESQRIELQTSIAGAEPEKVLVIETRDPVDKFLGAVKRIEGLEWLGEVEIDDIQPDNDFFIDGEKTKALNGRLFLIMTNQEALMELYSLWKIYSANPLAKLDYGKGKFKELFKYIYDIRYWNYKDRLNNTGIIEEWQRSLAQGINQILSVKIELWYRKDVTQRNRAEESIRRIISQNGGQSYGSCVINEIAYHAIMARLPISTVNEIINYPDSRLTQCDDVMFFRPKGQMSIGKNILDDGLITISPSEIDNLPTPDGIPLLALFDGLPLENHALLSGRIEVDDPDGWASEYEALYRYHGTAMASLIIHGDLTEGINPISNLIYARPILKPNSIGEEELPEETKPYLDLIYRAIKRLFEGECDTPPVAPNVKIINFSVCDETLPFFNSISPFARLLDWLSYKYGVLFIISAGNQDPSFSLPISYEEFNSLSSEELEKRIVQELYLDMHNRRILSPAESVNNLTIGTLHTDNCASSIGGNLIDIYQNILPSPISPFGFGYRKIIKPDLVFKGGRAFYQKPVTTDSPLIFERYIRSSTGPGCRFAATDVTAGNLFGSLFDQGTSQSAALISRYALFCYKSLHQILGKNNPNFEFEDNIAALIKAMIVHGCSWNHMENILNHCIPSASSSYQQKNWINRWIGFGTPDLSVIQECPENRISLIGYGSLENDEAHLYHLPLPPSLSGRKGKRRITITLAYFSPIFPETQKYLGSDLWFNLENEQLNTSRKESDYRTVQRGSVQHEILEGEDATPFEDGDTLDIRINCREYAGKHRDSIPYGLMVSLETAEELKIPVYDEVRTRIAPPIQISNIPVRP